MIIFNYCLFHNWVYSEKYYDCSDICFWSSITVYYRECKDCKKREEKLHYPNSNWKPSVDLSYWNNLHNKG